MKLPTCMSLNIHKFVRDYTFTFHSFLLHLLSHFVCFQVTSPAHDSLCFNITLSPLTVCCLSQKAEFPGASHCWATLTQYFIHRQMYDNIHALCSEYITLTQYRCVSMCRVVQLVVCDWYTLGQSSLHHVHANYTNTILAEHTSAVLFCRPWNIKFEVYWKWILDGNASSSNGEP